MKSYSTIEQRIDILQSRIEAYKEEIAVLQAEPKSNNERIKLKFFKTHSANISFNGFDYTNNTTTKGVIYLVRDPRDIVVSYSKFINKTYDEVI